MALTYNSRAAAYACKQAEDIPYTCLRTLPHFAALALKETITLRHFMVHTHSVNLLVLWSFILWWWR